MSLDYGTQRSSTRAEPLRFKGSFDEMLRSANRILISRCDRENRGRPFEQIEHLEATRLLAGGWDAKLLFASDAYFLITAVDQEAKKFVITGEFPKVLRSKHHPDIATTSHPKGINTLSLEATSGPIKDVSALGLAIRLEAPRAVITAPRCPGSKTSDIATSLAQFLDRSLFTRLWVIQEVILGATVSEARNVAHFFFLPRVDTPKIHALPSWVPTWVIEHAPVTPEKGRLFDPADPECDLKNGSRAPTSGTTNNLLERHNVFVRRLEDIRATWLAVCTADGTDSDGNTDMESEAISDIDCDACSDSPASDDSGSSDCDSSNAQLPTNGKGVDSPTSSTGALAHNGSIYEAPEDSGAHSGLGISESLLRQDRRGSIVVPCPMKGCHGKDAHVSTLIRKLASSHKIFICTDCWCRCSDRDDYKSHRDSGCARHCVVEDCAPVPHDSARHLYRESSCTTNNALRRDAALAYLCILLGVPTLYPEHGSPSDHTGQRKSRAAKLTVQGALNLAKDVVNDHSDLTDELQASRILIEQLKKRNGELERDNEELREIVSDALEETANLPISRTLRRHLKRHAHEDDKRVPHAALEVGFSSVPSSGARFGFTGATSNATTSINADVPFSSPDSPYFPANLDQGPSAPPAKRQRTNFQHQDSHPLAPKVPNSLLQLQRAQDLVQMSNEVSLAEPTSTFPDRPLSFEWPPNCEGDPAVTIEDNTPRALKEQRPLNRHASEPQSSFNSYQNEDPTAIYDNDLMGPFTTTKQSVSDDQGIGAAQGLVFGNYDLPDRVPENSYAQAGAKNYIRESGAMHEYKHISFAALANGLVNCVDQPVNPEWVFTLA